MSFLTRALAPFALATDLEAKYLDDRRFAPSVKPYAKAVSGEKSKRTVDMLKRLSISNAVKHFFRKEPHPMKRATPSAAARPKAKQAMETAAKTIDEAVRQGFDEFVNHATSGEKLFLKDVFDNHVAIYRDDNPKDLGIAGAFACSLENDMSIAVYDRERLWEMVAF